MKWTQLLSVLALLATALAAPHQPTESSASSKSKSKSKSSTTCSFPTKPSHGYIEVDVAVLGGGAAGTYAAIRLQDEGKTVAIIERNDRLGGHVESQYPPGIDYGVIAFLELPGTREFFARFGIDLVSAVDPGFATELIDLATGAPITSGNTINAAEDPQAVATALTTYAKLAAEYAQYTFPSLVQLPPSPEQPADLSLPFGSFVQKYNLEAALPTLFPFLEYVGDILKEPTAYIINLYGAVHLNATANGGLLIPNGVLNQELYNRAAAQLGSSVLFDSTVTCAQRNNDSVVLSVNHGSKHIKAKKLLVTIPPLASTLSPLKLDSTEKSIFNQWKYQAAYVGILNGTTFPDDTNIVNGITDDSSDAYNLPGTDSQPFVSGYSFTGFPSFFRTAAIGGPSFSADQAQAMMVEEAGSDAQLIAFASHTPLEVRATPKGLVDGFYQQAFGLNGHRNTYYAGAAWASDWTSIHWLYIEETILPMILAAL